MQLYHYMQLELGRIFITMEVVAFSNLVESVVISHLRMEP
jgi:hypothetical protein